MNNVLIKSLKHDIGNSFGQNYFDQNKIKEKYYKDYEKEIVDQCYDEAMNYWIEVYCV